MTLRRLIQAYEARLLQATLASDTAVLDALLADELLFTDQHGHLLTKQADLEAHRLRTLVLHALKPADQRIQLPQPGLALVSVALDVHGTYSGADFRGRYRYTRVWAERHGHWQVVAGHVSESS